MHQGPPDVLETQSTIGRPNIFIAIAKVRGCVRPGGRTAGSLENGFRVPLYTAWAPKSVSVPASPPKIGKSAPFVYQLSGRRTGASIHFGPQAVGNGPRRPFSRHPPGRTQARGGNRGVPVKIISSLVGPGAPSELVYRLGVRSALFSSQGFKMAT